MWIYLLVPVFFGAGYVLGRMQNDVRVSEVAEDVPGIASRYSREEQFGHLRPVLLALHALQGKQLDTNHMDELLEIEDLESEETKRSRRARIVSDVNSWGWTTMDGPVLTRERDEDDRRRMLYAVAHFELPVWIQSSVS
jgi:hypothetical protein